MSLRTRLSLVFALVALLPLLVGVILVAVLVPRALTDQVRARLTAGRALVTSEVAHLCGQLGLAAEIVGRLAASSGQPQLAAANVVTRGLASYAVFDPASGTAGVAGVLPGEPANIPAGELDSCTGSSDIPGVLSERVSVRDTRGRVLGVAAAAIPAAGALDRVIRGADVSVTLTLRGRPVASTLPAAAAALAATAATRAGAEPVAVGALLVSRAPLPAGLVAAVSARSPSVSTLDSILGALLAGGSLLAAALAWQLARATVDPLVAVADAASRVAAGDLNARIEVRSPAEIGRLAEAFNTMTEALRGSIEQIRSGHEALRHTLEQFGESLSGTLDIDRILAAVLEAAMTTTGARSGVIYLCQGEDCALTLHRGPAPLGLPAAAKLDALPSDDPVHRIRVDMRSGGVIRAVLLLSEPRAGSFAADARDAVRAFAAQAGVAIDSVRLHEEAQRLSTTDELTGLANFRALQQTLAKEVERATRFDRPLAFLMIDIDRFKNVNDRFGHQRGDAVLAEVAQRISGCVREVDTVARYGGEEFAVVLPEADAAGAARTAERICRAMRAAPMSNEDAEPVAVTVSVGAAVFPAHGPTAATLLRSADRALYAAKAAGRDRWRLQPLAASVREPLDR